MGMQVPYIRGQVNIIYMYMYLGNIPGTSCIQELWILDAPTQVTYFVLMFVMLLTLDTARMSLTENIPAIFCIQELWIQDVPGYII